jgi:hypothetical protein
MGVTLYPTDHQTRSAPQRSGFKTPAPAMDRPVRAPGKGPKSCCNFSGVAAAAPQILVHSHIERYGSNSYSNSRLVSHPVPDLCLI